MWHACHPWWHARTRPHAHAHASQNKQCFPIWIVSKQKRVPYSSAANRVRLLIACFYFRIEVAILFFTLKMILIEILLLIFNVYTEFRAIIFSSFFSFRKKKKIHAEFLITLIERLSNVYIIPFPVWMRVNSDSKHNFFFFLLCAIFSHVQLERGAWCVRQDSFGVFINNEMCINFTYAHITIGATKRTNYWVGSMVLDFRTDLLNQR